MVWSFEQSIYALDHLGIVDVILPFIIVFTIVFAALQKSKILGKDSKKYNVVIALVMGLAVVIPHVTGMYPPNGDVVQIMNAALPNVSLVAIAFVMVMLILGIIGGDMNFAGTSLGGIAIVVAIVAVLLIFLAASNVFRTMPWWLDWVRDPYVRELIVVILVFGIIIAFITKEDKDDAKGFGEGLKNMTDIFAGKKD
ncbi:hypothetical protein H8D36_04760 [archaeon]|nr:hypothetical protein [archaeon]